MLLKAAAAALSLALVMPVFAQEPDPLDVAILTCVGPGYTPDGDPLEVLDTLDKKSCTRVCKASAAGCRAVIKAIDKCGVSFLKSSAKIAGEICRGWGYTAAECRGIHAEAKADIDWWRAQGRIEQDECDRESESRCLSRCQAPAGVNYGDLVPIPLPERPEGQAGGAIVYLDWEAARQQALLRESPQGQEGARDIVVPSVELTNRGVDPLQGQADTRRGSGFVEVEVVSRFRETESSPASETATEIETPAD